MGVGAGFEGHVGRPAPGAIAGGFEGDLLRVRPASSLVEPLPRHPAAFVQDNRADHRVGAGVVVGPARKREGARHPHRVDVLSRPLRHSPANIRPCGWRISGFDNRIRSTRISSAATHWIQLL